MVKCDDVLQFWNTQLNSAAIPDASRNGLQVQGAETVRKIVFGVSASLELFRRAQTAGADLICVHHGLLWGHEQPLTGLFGQRVRFLMRPNCATVIRDRLDGAASALGLGGDKDFKIVAEPDDIGTLGPIFKKRTRPDAVICESDYVAAVFRNTLDKLGVSVPEDVMLAGFDDVRCAVTTFPQLTTIHQPCEDIALVAYRALRERILNPSLPPRQILLPAPLVVRESTKKS